MQMYVAFVCEHLFNTHSVVFFLVCFLFFAAVVVTKKLCLHEDRRPKHFGKVTLPIKKEYLVRSEKLSQRGVDNTFSLAGLGERKKDGKKKRRESGPR